MYFSLFIDLQELYLKNTNEINTINEEINTRNLPDNLSIGYRYYFITFSSDPKDGDPTDIKNALINNFLKFSALFVKVVSSIYAIALDENNNITLYGLLKQDTPSNCISITTKIFSNKIKNKDTKKTNDRPKSLENLTKYVLKTYQTEKDQIIHYWNFIYNKGYSQGNELEHFL
jgi:hypothetical protein